MTGPHAQPIEYALQKLETSPDGLSGAEAKLRLEKTGPNELKEKKRTPGWIQFLLQFKDFMILVLMAAAILSGIMGDITDMVIILVIVALNATVGYIQEYRAEKALHALKKMSVTQTQVLRDAHAVLISSTDLVPGDVVLLEAGNVVPADVRLMEAHGFRVDESSLTGESVPVDKSCIQLDAPDIPLADQVNMAFKGTLVANGRAKGIVVSTGMNTELGKIANLLQGKEAMTPLQVRMEQFGKKLSYIILLICGILFVTGILRGEDPFNILLLSISLAVAAIPEALPALITVALSSGAYRLAKKNALVRKLPAVETLGSVSFICSDKTGTLTQNKMQVVEKTDVSGIHLEAQECSMLDVCMALNHDVKINDALQPIGDSTEVAMVRDILEKIGLSGYSDIAERHPRLAELPFDSERKCMTTAHAFNGRFLVITKGASESISFHLQENVQRELLAERTAEWAGEGKRVLAYGYRILDRLPSPFTEETVEKELHLAGMVGLMDPPREEVKLAIAECRTAGITPVMITGDHPATAKAIARDIGILEERGLTMTGKELQQADEAEFMEHVEKVAVYARVSPEQKLQIVRSLQQKGHFVAMTGDGVNDAPSLKTANIGVAMGINGTDVSKEAADLVLLDDNFATIVKAVKEGRRIFSNIRKFVKYIMTCNGAEIWTIFLAPLFGMPIPLLPIHILWINLVTDGLPALALANEKPEPDIMKRPPRPINESLFADGVGFHILWVGLLMAGVTLAIQAYALHNNIEHWQTMVFTSLSLSQLGHVFAVRSERAFLFRQGILSNTPLVASVFLTFLLQMGVVYLPFMNGIFSTSPLSLSELGICIGSSLIVFHAVEFEKWIRGRIR